MAAVARLGWCSWRIGLAAGLALFLLSSVWQSVGAASSSTYSHLHEDEAALLLALDALKSGKLDRGIEILAPLVRKNPNFGSAQLLYARLLLARAGKFADLSDMDGPDVPRLTALRDELRARTLYREKGVRGEGFVPSQLLQLSPSQRWALVVDISAARLYLLENERTRLRLVSDNYVSTGKQGSLKLREGDQRTPLGVYFTTTRLDARHLSDFYGPGALALNYPNEWDMRLGRTGHGIWVHGVPTDTYSRAPRASDGCMALPNVNMAQILSLPKTGNTPVIIADHLDWVPEGVVQRRREEFMESFRTWRLDWQSLSFERYARHYAKDFASDDRSLSAWLRHKRRVNRQKSYIDVRIQDLSVLAYPGEEDMVVATFEQDYRSDNYVGVTRKRQYWRREADGVWRVIYEGDAKFRPVHLRGIPFSSRAGIALRAN